MLTPYMPYPPASGGQIRTYNLLKHLSKNHEITLISLYKNDEEKNFMSDLKPFCKKIYLCKRAQKPWQPNIILKAVLGTKPLLMVRNFSMEAALLVQQLLKEEEFDVIHAETSYIMPHIPETTIPTLLIEHTIEYKVYQHFIENLPIIIRPLLYIDIIKLKYWEKLYWKKASLVAAVSEADQKLIQTLAPEITPRLIPNGAGDDMFVTKLENKSLENPKLLFMGNYFWLQNKEAAIYIVDKIFPLLKDKLKNFKIIIAGQEAQRITLPYNDPRIEVVNIKNDDTEGVQSLYKNSTLFIAPIFGPGGTRLKILASMASGLPIVSTRIGVEGLDIEDEKHALIANTPEEFASQIVKALEDKKLYNEMRKNSFEHVTNKFSWHAIAKQLEVMYRSIINT